MELRELTLHKTLNNIMGAGTLYRHTNDELAVWIDFESNGDSFDEFAKKQVFEELSELIRNLGYYQDHNQPNIFFNGLFKLTLESKYHGDGIVFMLEPRHDEYSKEYNLANASFQRSENKILRAVQKAGYTLRIATSGYTSKDYII